MTIERDTLQSPNFCVDSAYFYIEKQLSFGPRVSGSLGHKLCGDYLVNKMKQFGADVTEQKTELIHYDKQKVQLRNIIASFQPEKQKRIALFAHWDTRPFADREKDKDRQIKPLPGADDGASGVGVLLEIARQLRDKPTDVGVDIIFFDLEDWGEPYFAENPIGGNWWCVGSTYWANNTHGKNYKAEFGILLDMVGAKDAAFYYEGYSEEHASDIIKKVWKVARNLGYGKYFINKNGSYITDDHVEINRKQITPCIDIINYKPISGFPDHWHKLDDDISNISKQTLKAVGQTVMEVIFLEKNR